MQRPPVSPFPGLSFSQFPRYLKIYLHRHWLILSIALLALGIRIASALFVLNGPLDWEGAEYARLAENLRNGLGYVGIDMPGNNLMFPPLYPLLISWLSYIVPNFEYAARTISILLGTITVFNVYLVGRYIYGAAAGHIAALFVAVHPLMVYLSASGCSEPTYICIITLYFYCVLRAFEEQQLRLIVFSGGLLGLAYLTRIEAAPLLLVPIGVILLTIVGRALRGSRPVVTLRNLLFISLLPATFAVVASPYVSYLYHQTGQLRLEGKSPLNLETARRVVVNGEPLWKVHHEVGDDLEERGVWNSGYLKTIHSARFDAREFAQYVARKIPRTARWIAHVFSGTNLAGIAFGAPVLTILALMHFWDARHTIMSTPARWILLGSFVLMLSQITLIVFESARFVAPLVPIMCLWAAAGVGPTFTLIRKWLASSPLVSRYSSDRALRYVLCTFGIGVLVVSHLAAIRSDTFWQFSYWARPIKLAAESLRSAPTGTSPTRPVIVGESYFAYHAGGQYIPFPFCSEDVAIRYFDKVRAQYVVLSESEGESAPYLDKWWREGIPSSSARLIREIDTSGERLRLYAWTK